jgi:hypothetical protein
MSFKLNPFTGSLDLTTDVSSLSDNDWTGINCFEDDKLQIWNPAKTFKYIFSTGAISADRTVDFPVITANETFDLIGTDQTITGFKRFDAATNGDIAQRWINASSRYVDWDVSQLTGATTLSLPRLDSAATIAVISGFASPPQTFTDAQRFTETVRIDDTLSLYGDALVLTTTGIDYGAGSDVDIDIASINVTGSPVFSWDESNDAFKFNKAAVIGDGEGDIFDTINGVTVTSDLEVHSEGTADLGGITVHRHTDTNDFGGHIISLKSRGVHGSSTILQDGDTVMRLIGAGYDGTDYATAAEIQFEVDGTPGTNDMPGRIMFFTSQD